VKNAQSPKRATKGSRSKLSPDNPEQFKRFIDMAREVEADESPEALDRAFNKVVRPAKPTKKPPQRP
jgi:hypothetical protein